MRASIHFFRTVIAGLTLSLGAACLPSSPPATAQPPAPAPSPVTLYDQTAAAVAAPATPRPIPTAQESPAAPTATAPCTDPDAAETAITYTITATLDYAARIITAEQAITVRNTTGDALDELVFYVSPNAQPGAFTLEDVALPDNSGEALATLEGVRLSIPLASPLAVGCTQALTLNYRVAPAQMGTGYFPTQGYLGYSDIQFNLGDWTPVLAMYEDGTWLTPARINIGEQTVTPAADYELALTVTQAPDDLVVVGPGTVEHSGATWRFTLPAARDLTLSMSDQYHQISAESASGVSVELYTFDDAQPTPDSDVDAPTQALQTAVSALDLYSDLYGAYPYERLVVLESAFPDGMEFTGLVFVGSEWFRTYTGEPGSYLTLITAHEVAHQWWYGLVASNQSAQPWLDEALATYSEYVFLQENYPDLADWWWGFRVDAFSPQGHVDGTVYQFDSVRGYINAVYLQGARFMHALRQDIGGEAFFQWLHDYVAAMRGQIAVPADLWAALPEDLLAATEQTRALYLAGLGQLE